MSRVWRALTDHREFGQRFRVALEGPFVPGKAIRGQITHPGYEHVTLNATVQRMEPERLLSFTWHPYAVDPKVDYTSEPPTLVEFELKAIPGGTLVVVTESGFAALPAHRRDEAFRAFQQWAALSGHCRRPNPIAPKNRLILPTKGEDTVFSLVRFSEAPACGFVPAAIKSRKCAMAPFGPNDPRP